MTGDFAPYYAVIFTSKRPAAAASSGYVETARRMDELAQQQPGYLGQDSRYTPTEDGGMEGVTISYWTDEESIKGWRDDSEHRAARARGRAEWYESWNIRVCKIEREYGSPQKAAGGASGFSENLPPLLGLRPT
ncbi:hypothetical protein HWV62_6285 [Athelia sp. TMB]|nr:hypothetical protein HWV62_38951 [Athelia sp. TMB]KAF7976493.1 hypothetical protein HWV62_6285 [Athelia sp. TMB]